MKCATSLWSADLSNLAAEMRRVEPYSERFHLDVADGHYVNTMLFFPDLVKSLRRHTKLPIEVHLATHNPLNWIEPFAEAGADIIIFCLDSYKEPGQLIGATRSLGKKAGLSILPAEPVDLLQEYWAELDTVTIMGTVMGIKGATMDPCVPKKIMHARQIVTTQGLQTQLEADGGIRRNTVPLIYSAGADFIVPGSLMFDEDPRTMHRWLHSLSGINQDLF
jgi:ribulose-phosphate 3-epimerase